MPYMPYFLCCSLPKACLGVTSTAAWLLCLNYCVMQAKPYINEAHVFNDAGVSFDVWPPSINDIQDKPTGILRQACSIGQQQDDDGQSSIDNQECSNRGTSSGAFSAQSHLSSREHSGHVCKDDSNTTAQTSAQSEAGTAGMGRGYLLAAKLWQEAVLTLAASALDKKP